MHVHQPRRPPPAADEACFRAIRRDVHRYVREVSPWRIRAELWLKAVLLLGLLAVSWVAVFQVTAWWALTAAYIGSGFATLGLGFNFAHDGAHDTLFRRRWANRAVFEAIFALLGANGHLWKKRHVHAHHPYPNVEHFDTDLEAHPVIRLSPYAPFRPIHRFQHWYAPFLYHFYTLIWVFYKDFALFVRRRHANLTFGRHPDREWLKLLVFKMLYLGLYLVLPAVLTDFPVGQVMAAFLAMHLIVSPVLLFTFLITHHVEPGYFPPLDGSGDLTESWMRHQVQASIDFHAESRLVSALFGGFNCHVAHHLFPSLNHIYYPQTTAIIRRHLRAQGIAWCEMTYWGGVVSHLRLLRTLGKS